MQFLAACLKVLLTCTDDPTGFHVQPYLQWPERDAITVMWETAEPLVGEVRFGPTPGLDQRAAEPEPRRVHEIRLTGLLPETRYYYRVAAGGLSSSVASFRTAPGPAGGRWRLGVYGDSRSFPDRHKQVAELIGRFNPDLVVHTGDQVTRGSQRPLWKTQFFDPAASLFSRVPVVTSLGNHEEQAGNYFEYLAMPGNEHYFSLDFGNAHIVILDSNTWGPSARDSDQYMWLKEDLSRQRTARWTFVAFHHPLFSAHDKRSINRGRWDWCPLFEDLGVDLVLTGHDHFYYRSWPIGRLSDGPSRGITHITTAGGGAPLYQLKPRSYTAVENSVHHGTILDFTDDAISGEVIDLAGKRVDQFRITKEPTPAADFCAYEVFELERAIRHEIESRAPTVVPGAQVVTVDDLLSVPHTFRVPVAIRLQWDDADTAGVVAQETKLQPGEPLRIPLKRQVKLPPSSIGVSTANSVAVPGMKLTFFDNRFRNREIDFAPLKLWPDITVRSRPVSSRPSIEQALTAARPAGTVSHGLIRADGRGAAKVPADLSCVQTGAELIVVVRVLDPKVTVADANPAARANDQAGLLKREHARLLFATAEHTYSFAVSADGQCGDACDGDWSFENSDWSAFSQRQEDSWVTMITVPRELLGDPNQLRITFVHSNPSGDVEDCLCPTFDVGSDPDRVPDFRFGDRKTERFAKVLMK